MADTKDAALELLLLLEEDDDDVDSLLDACTTSSLPLLLLAPGDYASAFAAQHDPELLCRQQQPVPRLTSSSSSYNTNREHDDTTSTPVDAPASHLQPASDVIHLTNDTEAMDNIVIYAPRKKRTTTKSVTRNPKPKPTNQRQKAELALLRSQVSELQQELITLQARVQNNATRFNGTPARHSLAQQRSGTGLRAISSKSESIWEATTNRQQKERYRAESENTELKVSVAEQLKFVKSLQQMVNKRQVRRTPQPS